MLVEVWLTLKWKIDSSTGKPPRDEGYPLALGKFDVIARKEYPNRVPLDSNRVPLEITPHTPRLQYVKKRDDEKHKLLQIGPGIATINYLTDYTWNSFSKDSIYLRDTVISAYEDNITFQYVSLQYRNAIPFDYGKNNLLVFIKANFGIDISIPKNFTGNKAFPTYPTNANYKFSFDLKSLAGKGNYILATGLKKEEKGNVIPVIIQESEIVSELKNVPDVQNQKEFEKWLKEANEIANTWNFKKK